MTRRIARFLATSFAGYAVMIGLIIVVQELIFGGVTYAATPTAELLLAGVLTAAAGAVGSAAAAWLFGAPYYPPSVAIGALVIAETTGMILADRLPGPVWFDVLAAVGLLTGIVLGAILIQRSAAAPAGPQSA